MKNNFYRKIIGRKINMGMNEKPFGIGKILEFIRPEIKKHRHVILTLALMMFIASLIGLALPQVQRIFIDVLTQRDDNKLIPAMLVLGVLSALKMTLSALANYFAGRQETILSFELKERIFSHLLDLPSDYFSRRGGSYFSGRLFSDISGVRVLFSPIMLGLLQHFINLIGGFLLLLWLDWRLALPVFVLLFPFYYLMRNYFRRHYNLHIHRGEAQAGTQTSMQRALSNMRLVKSGAREKAVKTEIKDKMIHLQDLQLDILTSSMLFGRQLRLIPMAVRVIYLIFGAFMVVRNQWTLGYLWAIQAYLALIFGPIQSIASGLLNIQQGKASARRLAQLLEVLPEQNLECGRLVDKLDGQIEFKGVHFAFDSDFGVLKGVDLSLKPKEHLLITGTSGAGKSSLLGLIPGFLMAQQGEILIDNVNIREYNLRSLRDRIGWVETTPEFFEGTLKENLAKGNQAIGGDKIEHYIRELCSDSAMADKFIAKLNDRVGEYGRNFSAGERLRLSIIRELLREPDIIILDEPTATLDATHEQLLADLLETKLADRTLIVVSHRKTLMQRFDRIIFLADGRVAGEGSYDDLIDNNADFCNLVKG